MLSVLLSWISFPTPSQPWAVKAVAARALASPIESRGQICTYSWGAEEDPRKCAQLEGSDLETVSNHFLNPRPCISLVQTTSFPNTTFMWKNKHLQIARKQQGPIYGQKQMPVCHMPSPWKDVSQSKPLNYTKQIVRSRWGTILSSPSSIKCYSYGVGEEGREREGGGDSLCFILKWD